jgi:hypothetical protein
MIFSVSHERRKNQFKTILDNAIILALIYLIFYSLALTLGNHGLLASQINRVPKNNSITNESINNNEFTASNSAQIATPIPSLKQKQQIKNNEPIHDGSRTGKIVDYYSYCDKKSIKIYENELLYLTANDGKKTYSTQKDLDCYNKDLSSSSNNQQNALNNRTNEKSYVNNVYCWNNAYGYSYYTTSGDQCNADNLKDMNYKSCMDTQKSTANQCNSACQTKLDEDRALCAWAYTGQNAGMENNPDKYGDCLNGPEGAGENYSSCLAICTNEYSNNIKKCN